MEKFLNKLLRIRIIDEREIEGVLVSVDKQGNLILNSASGFNGSNEAMTYPNINALINFKFVEKIELFSK